MITFPMVAGDVVVTYAAGGGGEFPHSRMWWMQDEERCSRSLTLVPDSGGPESIDACCTREVGHAGPHVEHLEPGRPLIAWLARKPGGSR